MEKPGPADEGHCWRGGAINDFIDRHYLVGSALGAAGSSKLGGAGATWPPVALNDAPLPTPTDTKITVSGSKSSLDSAISISADEIMRSIDGFVERVKDSSVNSLSNISGKHLEGSKEWLVAQINGAKERIFSRHDWLVSQGWSHSKIMGGYTHGCGAFISDERLSS